MTGERPPIFKDQGPEEDVFKGAIVGQRGKCGMRMEEAGARSYMALGWL